MWYQKENPCVISLWLSSCSCEVLAQPSLWKQNVVFQKVCKYWTACCQGGASLSCSASISHILRGSRKWSTGLLQQELIKILPVMFGLTATRAVGVSNSFQKAGISEYLHFVIIVPSFFTLAMRKHYWDLLELQDCNWNWCLIHYFLKIQVIFET